MRLTLTDLLNTDADRKDENPSNAARTPANTAADETRVSIDKQIRGLKESIRSLRSTRNTLAPVSKLPTELLSQVFKYIDDDPISECKLAKGASEEEIRARCHCLWTSLIFSGVGNPECVVEEMVTRSRASALSVKLISDSDYLTFEKLSPDMVAKIFNTKSMQELHLTLGEDQLKKVIRGITLAAIAYKMQSLTIRQTYSHFDPVCPLFDISSNLLSTYMPHLRNLDIRDCHIQWNALRPCVYHELISLRLSNVPKPPRDSFFNLLSHIPNLEILHLESALPPFITADPRESIKLPRLTSCTIKSSTLSQCLDFQTHVSYPTAKAKLRFDLSSSHEMSFRNLQPELAARALALLSSCGITADNPQRSHSCLLFEFFPSFKIALWDEDTNELSQSIPTAESSIANPAVSITLSTQPHASAVLDLLSIAGLDMFSIRWGREEDLRTHLNALFKFFKRHQDITRLHLTDGQTYLAPLLSTLSCSANNEYAPETSDGRDSKKAFIPCLPKLATLTLEGCNLAFKTDRRSLLAVLTRYRGAGTTIRKITISRCVGLDGEFVEDLKKMVEEVDWDGHSEAEDECDSEFDESEEECGLCCDVHGPEFDCTDRASYRHRCCVCY